MATDINIGNLILNEMTEAQLQSLKNSGTVPANQIFFTNDASPTSALPLGMLISSSCVQRNAGLHLADGGELAIGGVYDDFCQYVINNIDDFPHYDTVEQWQEDIAKYGQCGKYVVTSSYIKLPRITKYVEGINSLDEIGKSIEAGLPNITGKYYARGIENSGQHSEGAFQYIGGANDYGTGHSGGWNGGFTFDASRSSQVYGRTDTVQPQTTKYPYYIVVANITKTDIEANIDNITADLNRLSSSISNLVNPPSPTLLYTSGGATSGAVNLSESIRNFRFLIFEADTSDGYLTQNTYCVTSTLTTLTTYFGVYGYSNYHINMRFITDTQMYIDSVNTLRLRNIYGVK